MKLAAALGLVYVVWGSTSLAIAVADRTLPPLITLSVRFLLAGAILYYARQYDRAIRQLRSVRAVDPTLSRAYLLISVYADHGMLDQALAEEARWRSVVPAPIHWSALA